MPVVCIFYKYFPIIVFSNNVITNQFLITAVEGHQLNWGQLKGFFCNSCESKKEGSQVSITIMYHLRPLLKGAEKEVVFIDLYQGELANRGCQTGATTILVSAPRYFRVTERLAYWGAYAIAKSVTIPPITRYQYVIRQETTGGLLNHPHLPKNQK